MKIRTGYRLALMGGIILVSLMACRFFSPPVTTTPQVAIPVENLRFMEAKIGERFRMLDGCIMKIAGTSWRTTSYQLLGNFYQSDWCTGAGARNDCQIAGATIDQRDQHDISLYTLFYLQDYPQVFGLGLQALWVPKSTGWGASFYFAEQGQGIVGEGWGVTFSNYNTPSGPTDSAVSLGWKYSYTIYGPHETTFEQAADLSLREDLASYLASPASMRDLGVKQIQTLASKVDEAIRSHQVQTCDQGPYQGQGIPPACTLQPMTAGEEGTERDKARVYFSNEENDLREHYLEMYAAWMAAFPLDQCWPQ
jgi:hypothetical protein